MKSIRPSDRTAEVQTFPPILGLVGPLGVGKTTTADAVVALVQGRRLSCAGPIRDMLAALGVDRVDLSKRKNTPIHWLHDQTPRSLMKSLGTEWGRSYVGEDVWINAVLRQAQELGQDDTPVVIDDIRFDNEALAILRAGGHLMFLSRPDVDYSYEHPSECGLSDWGLIDAAVDMVSGNCLRGGEQQDLLPGPRPGWSNWDLGRKLVRLWREREMQRQPKVAKVPPLAEATKLAAGIRQAWSELTHGRVSASAPKRPRGR